ncbi:alginate export family protein [Sphingomonas sp.]|uniref:alginate export family protein n=1 Tax=Sphingomonas sp. TaxID=28214 RepID=UPI002ED88F1F
MRLRYERIDGQPRTGFDKRDDLINLRTTLAAGYDAGPVRFDAELWDSRVWLDGPGTPVSTGEVNTLELVQANVSGEIPDAFGKRTSLRIAAGRFTLNLGSRRLVAADDYRNTTNGYTGVRADVGTAGGFTATLVYVLPQVRLPDDPAELRRGKIRLDREGFDLVLWGGIAARRKAIGEALAELSFFHLGERDTPGRAPTRDRSLNTAGARLVADPAPGRFDYEVEAFYQWGRASAGTGSASPRLPVSATFVHAEAGYSFAGGWKPRIAVEFDRASGDAPGGSYGRFDTLFGMRRADLAPSGLYNAIGRANIVAAGVRVEAAPGRDTDFFLAARPLWLAASRDSFSTSGVRDASGRAGSYAGLQWDARVRHWLRKDRLRFEGNMVVLRKGRFFRQAPNRNPGGDTLYLSLNLTASF